MDHLHHRWFFQWTWHKLCPNWKPKAYSIICSMYVAERGDLETGEGYFRLLYSHAITYHNSSGLRHWSKITIQCAWFYSMLWISHFLKAKIPGPAVSRDRSIKFPFSVHYTHSHPQGHGWASSLLFSFWCKCTEQRRERELQPYKDAGGGLRGDLLSWGISPAFPSKIKGWPPCFKQLQSQVRPSLPFPLDMDPFRS